MEHAKKLGNMAHTQKKENQSIETIHEEIQTLDLLNNQLFSVSSDN